MRRHGWHRSASVVPACALALALGAAATARASAPGISQLTLPDVQVGGLATLTLTARDPDDAVNGMSVDFGDGEDYEADIACRRERTGGQPRTGPLAPGTPYNVQVPYDFAGAGIHLVTVEVTSGACHGTPETVRRTVLVTVLPKILPPGILPPLARGSAVAIATGGCPDADLRPAAGRLGRVGTATICLMNAQRAAARLPAVRSDRRLRGAAITHSLDMVRRDYLAHEAPRGPRLSTRVLRAHYATRRQRWTLGENIAAATGRLSTPRRTVAAWMRSPGHRANVLNGRFRDVGVGPVVGVPGRGARGATYTVDFGRRG